MIPKSDLHCFSGPNNCPILDCSFSLSFVPTGLLVEKHWRAKGTHLRWLHFNFEIFLHFSFKKPNGNTRRLLDNVSKHVGSRYVNTWAYVYFESFSITKWHLNLFQSKLLFVGWKKKLCLYFGAWYFFFFSLPSLSLIKLKVYNYGKWSQLLNKVFNFIFYEKNRR
jgi:hypothetical protein